MDVDLNEPAVEEAEGLDLNAVVLEEAHGHIISLVSFLIWTLLFL